MSAPIVLFVYNRLEKTIRTIEALKRNFLAEESQLFIYSDGPRSVKDTETVQKVRAYIRTVKGFKNVSIIEQEKNLGLADSVIKGVTEVVNREGRIIALEDDIETSPYFLQYMNDGLDIYEKEEKVISIHAYMYPVKTQLPEYFFLRGADCWGWATWKRGWDLFEADGKKLLDELKRRKLTKKFDFDNSARFTVMLEEQIQGKISSWAIRWNASAFLKGKYTLYPGKSLIVNTGTDGTGTHGDETQEFFSKINNQPVKLKKIPVKENTQAYKAIADFFKPRKKSFWSKILDLFSANLIF